MAEDAGSTAGVVEGQTAGQAQEDKSTNVVASNSNMLQHLVTEAVKKVLADQEVTDTEKVSQNIVSQVVEGLKPTLASSSTTSIRNTTPNIGKHIAIPPPITRPAACVYNPTPIAELKKRHIPVISYMPTRESRVAVKRKPSPERAKWLNDVQESSSSQQSEITYKPTAIVNSTDQDAVQSYIPTVKSDSLSSNSYEDSNSSDYQSKFKEEYYPKSKKRREEYVPKKIKTPLKTVQQLSDATLNQFEPEFDMIDEILTSRTAPNALEHVKASASEDSQDYSLEMESKFSDDESIEDISKDENKESVKKAEQAEDVNEKEKENLQHTRSETVDKQMSNKDKHNNHYDTKTGDTQTSDRSKEHKAKYESKSLDRKGDSVKENTDKDKERRRDHSRSKEKNRKDNHHNSSKDKERYKHRSDSRDRHGSSSSRNKDKIKSSRDSKDSLHSSKKHSDSRKHRRASPKKDRNNHHHKSSRHDKHKSTSNSSSSKSNKHTSSKSDKKHHSESSRKSSDSSRKSSKCKESSSEKHSSDRSDNSEGSVLSFVDDETLVLSDSDHDVQEECLRIFQVNIER